MRSVLDRLLDHVEYQDRGFTSECWVWTGVTDSHGYGMIRVGSRTDGTRRMRRAHIAAYEQLVGPSPDGMDLDHLCRVHECCRPEHIEPVTRSENVRRGTSPDALRARFQAMTHCTHGHEYNEANTYLWTSPRGHVKRVCRVCKNERRRTT